MVRVLQSASRSAENAPSTFARRTKGMPAVAKVVDGEICSQLNLSSSHHWVVLS